jgi:hypothetical protein
MEHAVLLQGITPPLACSAALCRAAQAAMTPGLLLRGCRSTGDKRHGGFTSLRPTWPPTRSLALSLASASGWVMEEPGEEKEEERRGGRQSEGAGLDACMHACKARRARLRTKSVGASGFAYG